MATDTKTQAQAQDTKLPAPIGEPGDDFMPLSSNRLIYKAENLECQKRPVRGFLLGRIEMPPVGGDREWSALIVRLTHPCVGLTREGQVEALEKGDEMLIPVTHVLDSDQKIQVIARSPEWTAEIWLKPTKKIAIGGGQTLWQFDTRMAPPRKRTQEEKMYNLQGAIGAPAQLPVANGQAATAPPPF